MPSDSDKSAKTNKKEDTGKRISDAAGTPFLTSWGQQGSNILDQIAGEQEQGSGDESSDGGSRLGHPASEQTYLLTTADKENVYQHILKKLGQGTNSIGQYIKDTVAAHLQLLIDRISNLEKQPRSSGLTQAQLGEWDKLKEAYERTLVERNDFANRIKAIEDERERDRSELVKIMTAAEDLIHKHYATQETDLLAEQIVAAKLELKDLSEQLAEARKNAPPPPPSTATTASVLPVATKSASGMRNANTRKL